MLGVALRDQHGLGESRMCWARCSVAETSRKSSNADEVAAGRRKGKVQNARLADPSRVKLRSKLEIPALLCLSYSNSRCSAHARAAGDPLCFSRWRDQAGPIVVLWGFLQTLTGDLCCLLYNM